MTEVCHVFTRHSGKHFLGHFIGNWLEICPFSPELHAVQLEMGDISSGAGRQLDKSGHKFWRGCWATFWQVCWRLWAAWVSAEEQPRGSHGLATALLSCCSQMSSHTEPCHLPILCAWVTIGTQTLSDPMLMFKGLNRLLCKQFQRVLQVTCMASCGHDAGCGWGFGLFGFFLPFVNNEESLLQNILLEGGNKGREVMLPSLYVPCGSKAASNFQKLFLSTLALWPLMLRGQNWEELRVDSGLQVSPFPHTEVTREVWLPHLGHRPHSEAWHPLELGFREGPGSVGQPFPGQGEEEDTQSLLKLVKGIELADLLPQVSPQEFTWISGPKGGFVLHEGECLIVSPGLWLGFDLAIYPITL